MGRGVRSLRDGCGWGDRWWTGGQTGRWVLTGSVTRLVEAEGRELRRRRFGGMLSEEACGKVISTLREAVLLEA